MSTSQEVEERMVQPIRIAGTVGLVALAALLAAAPLRSQSSTGIAAQTGSDAPEARALRDAGGAMHAGMTSVRQSGDADRDFVASMIPHQQGAIDMATVELQFGKDEETRQLAERIIAAQEKQIAEMNAWLARHPAPQ
ncbi:MAG TPA: DUF305 domain-containing protein [Stellaceae bacterium]|nr:DUF305 domain-containing protein [Stellaceae bacterium]